MHQSAKLVAVHIYCSTIHVSFFLSRGVKQQYSRGHQIVASIVYIAAIVTLASVSNGGYYTAIFLLENSLAMSSITQEMAHPLTTQRALDIMHRVLMHGMTLEKVVNVFILLQQWFPNFLALVHFQLSKNPQNKTNHNKFLGLNIS